VPKKRIATAINRRTPRSSKGKLVGNRKDELKKWALVPAVAALLALSGGADAKAADLDSEKLDSSVVLSTHGGDGSCKDGECKDGECKDGDCKDGECKDGECKDGECKSKDGGE
jgi:uncharacterized low-complexity protein